MNFISPELSQYIDDHSEREPELLKKLSRETWQKVVQPRMLSGHVQGRFLSLISHLMAPKRILEIGTYTGYSALCLCEGLAAGGELVTIDINDELQWIQDKYFQASDHHGKIKRIFGNALEVLPSLDLAFDLVFIDADKENYIRYYELLIEALPPGACILVDNVLWSGKVMEPILPGDEETRVIGELNDLVTSDSRVHNVLLPLRDGVMMIRKK